MCLYLEHCALATLPDQSYYNGLNDDRLGNNQDKKANTTNNNNERIRRNNHHKNHNRIQLSRNNSHNCPTIKSNISTSFKYDDNHINNNNNNNEEEEKQQEQEERQSDDIENSCFLAKMQS